MNPGSIFDYEKREPRNRAERRKHYKKRCKRKRK